MDIKCHNHTLQTNPGYHEEETQGTNSRMPLKCYQSKAASYLFIGEMIAKLETTLIIAKQNNDLHNGTMRSSHITLTDTRHLKAIIK